MKPGSAKWSLPTFEPVVIKGSLTWFSTLGMALKLCLLFMACVLGITLTMILVQTAKSAIGKKVKR